MTPLEAKPLRILGTSYLYDVEELSIGIFFYGMSSSLVIYGPATSSITGVFVVLFSASVVIFVFVLSLPASQLFLLIPRD